MQSTKFMLGIITAIICSNWLGDLVHSDGIYETDLEADGSVVYLRPSPPSGVTSKPAHSIGSDEAWCSRPSALTACLSADCCWHCQQAAPRHRQRRGLVH